MAKHLFFCLCLLHTIEAAVQAQRPEVVAQTGHANPIVSFAFSRDARLSASGDVFGVIKIWDNQTGILLRTINAHSGELTTLSFNADGQVLASESRAGFSNAELGRDGTTKLWQVRTGKLLREIKFDLPQLAHFAFSPDGSLFATGSKGNTINLWNAQSGSLVKTLAGHSRPVGFLVFSPDGKLLGSANRIGFEKTEYGDFIDQPCEKSKPEDHAKLWDLGTEKVIANLQGCGSVHFSSSGKLVADDKGNIYEATSGKPLGSLNGEFIAFSRDEKIAFLWADESTLKVMDLETGRLRHAFTGLLHHAGIIFSPDGQRLVVKREKYDEKLQDTIGSFEIRNSLDGRLLDRREGYFFGNFSFDGRLFVASRNAGNGNRALALYDAASGQALTELAKEKAEQLNWNVWFSSDGRVLVTQQDESLKLWGLPGGELRHTPRGGSQRIASAVALSPNGQILALARGSDFPLGSGDQIYELWDTRSGALTRTFSGNTNVTGNDHLLSFTKNGEMLLTGDGQLRDVQSGTSARTFPGNIALGSQNYALITSSAVEVRDMRNGKLLSRVNASDVREISLSPDGKLLAVGYGTNDIEAHLMLYDAATGRLMRSFKSVDDAVRRISFSEDGRMIAVMFGSGSGGFVTNLVFDVRTGLQLTDFVDDDQQKNPGDKLSKRMFLTFSPDSKMAVLQGAEVDTVELRALPSGKLIKTLSGVSSHALSAGFSRDGRILVTGDADAGIRFWAVASGELLATAFSSEGGNWLVVTPDGLFDGPPGGFSGMLWRFGGDTFNIAPAEIYFNEFYYPGLLSDIFAGQRPKAIQDITQKDRRQPAVQLGVSQPGSAGVITARTVSLRLKVAEAAADKEHPHGSGAQDLRLFRNGSLVRVWKGDVLNGGRTAVLEANDIPIVAGENRFQAYAFNRDNIKSADANLVVKGADSLRRKGTMHILAIGINEYANPQFNLQYAVADAQAFGAEFKQQQERLGQYERVEVSLLQDTEATKANVLRAIEEISKRAQPEDAVIVYFAGHGTAEGSRFYLIPHDIGYTGAREQIGKENLDPLLSHSISDIELQQGFEKMDAGQVLLVIDACNSGQALEDEEKRRGPMNSKGLAQLAYEKGMYVLTAAQSFQAALELAQLGHGLLTFALIEEGLKSNAADAAPKDGELRVREWFDYATNRVPQMQEEKLKLTRAARAKVVSTTGRPKGFAMQQPRAFYRRELEVQSLVIARTSPTSRP